MKRLGELTIVCALAPLLFGFGVLEKRDAEIEAGNAALKAGKAEDALGHYDQAVKKLPGDAGAHFDRGIETIHIQMDDCASLRFWLHTECLSKERRFPNRRPNKTAVCKPPLLVC